jgi:hypothetical protein
MGFSLRVEENNSLISSITSAITMIQGILKEDVLDTYLNIMAAPLYDDNISCRISAVAGVIVLLLLVLLLLLLLLL